jgi:tetratricopeptide (TPR) repeat protein
MESPPVHGRGGCQHNSLGEALVRQEKLTEAITYFYKAVELNPNYDKPYGNLVTVLAQQGKLDEAVKYYHIALQINPTIQIVNTNLLEGIK